METGGVIVYIGTRRSARCQYGIAKDAMGLLSLFAAKVVPKP